MAAFTIFKYDDETLDGSYTNSCYISSPDVSDSEKASPEQLTVSTIVGLIDDTKDDTKEVNGERILLLLITIVLFGLVPQNLINWN